MNTRIRQTLVAVAFAATVAAGITGATLRGETKETDLAATCAAANWPMIPAECLQGARQENVRYVSADKLPGTEPTRMAANTELADRFSVAFQ
jgi:hypothetical protein